MNESINIEIDENQTILDLKKEIEKLEACTPEQQILISSAQILMDKHTIASYNLNESSKISLRIVENNDKQDEKHKTERESQPIEEENQENKQKGDVRAGRGFGGYCKGTEEEKVEESINEEELEKGLNTLVTEMKFDKDQATLALRCTNGKVEEAVNLLTKGKQLTEADVPHREKKDSNLKDDIWVSNLAMGEAGKVGPLDSTGGGFGRGFGGFSKTFADGEQKIPTEISIVIVDKIENQIALERTEHGAEVKLTQEDKDNVDKLMEMTNSKLFQALEAYAMSERDMDKAVNIIFSVK
eukprot:MONOS_10364.1-p1 / transcript=MONOS_10364.1 / gene=MONOS_10364 / organism=Monocercomonoides_exilis_PA203 / gene_product=unspecified product / transcript_product=unspecified product / location=Mono_scaffold00468:10780-12136(-) / protein_length=298 / sequence_SO=supercontig / SO=protein_coding / is_pseudo=false